MKSADRMICGFFVAGVVAAAGLGWYSLRAAMRGQERTSEEILARLGERNEALTRLGQKMGATTRGLGSLRTDLARMLERLNAGLEHLSPPIDAGEELTSTEEGAPVDDVENLPPLPSGLAARFLVSDFQKPGKVWEIIRNPALNPGGKEPEFLEEAEILRELVHAKARMDMLRADVQVGVAEARLLLAADGEYIDFAPGEKYLSADGAVTVGEKTDDGKTRMYYLHAEEFPEIHEKRAEEKRIADRALRRIMSILQ